MDLVLVDRVSPMTFQISSERERNEKLVKVDFLGKFVLPRTKNIKHENDGL